MGYNRVVISSGHGLYVRGASGILDEVDEARRVVDKVAVNLKYRGIEAMVFHDDVSKSQNENLNRIVDFHNKQTRDLDISVHFNAYEQVTKPMGVEVLYLTQEQLADDVALAISSVGLINRGPKKRTDLFFLNSTSAPSILIETCFVDSEADSNIYQAKFDAICDLITDVVSGYRDSTAAYRPALRVIGKVSSFGGPDDEGVDPDEGLAFIDDIDDAPYLFLPNQPEGTTGLARRLNPYVHYVACRWDYDVTPKDSLLKQFAMVRASATGIAMAAFPADWGPHQDTGRVADISPGLLADLGITTDDEVEVIFPHPREALITA